MILEGVSVRLKREQNERAWLAWHVAALGRVKKLPKLKNMTVQDRGRRRMTPEELEAVTRSWLASARQRQHHGK